MSKIKIKMKLTGFELEIEGTKEDVPAISQSLSRQLQGLLQPPDAVLNGQPSPVRPLAAEILPAQEVEGDSSVRKKPRKRRTTSTASEVDAGDLAVDWRHDATKYGNPRQEWNTATKAVWTLYVVAEETQEKELSARRIASTFNKHFRQAKTITVTNVTRDLGKLKLKSPAVVSEDTTKTPAEWYLTQEGIRSAQQLVGEALGRSE